MLAPVARLAGAHEPHGAGFAAALPRGARCGGGGGSSLEDAFAGGSRRSSLGDSFASSGGTDAPRTRSTTTTAAGSRCSPNPFASPALGSSFDAAFEGGFERRRSDSDFDAAFSCAPSWFKVSRMSFSNDGAPPYPQPWPKRCYGLGPPVRVSERRWETASAPIGSLPPSPPVPQPLISGVFQPIAAPPSPHGAATAASSNPFRKSTQPANGGGAAPAKPAAVARKARARPPRAPDSRKPSVSDVLQLPSEAHRARCVLLSNGCT